MSEEILQRDMMRAEVVTYRIYQRVLVLKDMAEYTKGGKLSDVTAFIAQFETVAAYVAELQAITQELLQEVRG